MYAGMCIKTNKVAVSSHKKESVVCVFPILCKLSLLSNT